MPALPPGLLWAHLVMPCHAGLPWAPHGLQESCRPGRGRVLGAPTVPELLGSHWTAPSLAASSPLGTPGCPPDPGFHCPVGCPAERGGRESGPWGAEGGHGGDSWDPSRPASALSWPKWEVPASRLRYWGPWAQDVPLVSTPPPVDTPTLCSRVMGGVLGASGQPLTARESGGRAGVAFPPLPAETTPCGSRCPSAHPAPSMAV